LLKNNEDSLPGAETYLASCVAYLEHLRSTDRDQWDTKGARIRVELETKKGRGASRQAGPVGVPGDSSRRSEPMFARDFQDINRTTGETK
jgi:hypothetical protein